MPKVHWAVESLVVKGNVLFGFGWVFQAHNEEIVSLSLQLLSERGDQIGSIGADYGKTREDVRALHPTEPTALNSGFVVYGAVPSSEPVKGVVLECLTGTGTEIQLHVPSPSIVNFDVLQAAEVRLPRLRQYWQFFRRGLNLVRAGSFAALVEKVRRYVKARPKSALEHPKDLVRLLRGAATGGLILVLDHDLGGGANQYRERILDAYVKNGGTALILTYHVATLTHVVIVRSALVNERYAIRDRSLVLQAMEDLELNEIIYNTGVSFVNPEGIPEFILSLRSRTSARLKVFLHDYFVVCPSHFLLNHEDQYCGIPDLNVCASCLPKNNQGFASLFAERDIVQWRALWGAVLAVADELVAFSRSAAVLVRKAYPSVHPDRIRIQPHSIDHISRYPIRIEHGDDLKIGVVGRIGFHKGAQVIKALAKEIKKRGLETKIMVIGTIEANCDPAVVKQTGPYKHAQLPRLIEKTEVNVMLFPSVCPETFSYVVHELIDLDLPVASFDFGAPAERLASYPKGRVLSSIDPAVVLDELLAFHRKVYQKT